MSQRTLHVSLAETAPPLSAEQCLLRRVLATHLANQRLFPNSSPKKTPADMPRTLKPQGVPADALRLKSKVKDLCYNASGSRLFVASREGVTVLDADGFGVHATLSLKCVRVLAHPSDASLFALLVMEGADTARPCVKVYSLPETVGEEPVLRATAWSGFDDAWYAGAWSLDGAAITAVDRGDRLQRVAVSEPADCELDAAAAVSLASEVYGLLYTSDALVVQKVDGCIDIMSPEFVLRASEQAHSHIVLAAAYNKERDLLATGGSDHVVHVFSCADDYTCVGSFSGLEGKVSSVSFSPDGMLLAWGTKDTSHVASEEVAGPEGGSPEEYYLTVAGTDPCEVYLQVRMPAAVSHVQFAPTGYAIAYACDLDLMPKGSSVPSAVGVLNLA